MIYCSNCGSKYEPSPKDKQIISDVMEKQEQARALVEWWHRNFPNQPRISDEPIVKVKFRCPACGQDSILR